jgi:hypothetical protein
MMQLDQSLPASNERKEADWAAPVWAAIRDYLEGVKAPINRAIRDTPPPIPCCDARFNHLLEERSGIARELNRLEALRSQMFEPGREAEAIEEFLRSSPYIDEDAARTLGKSL